MWHLIRPVRRHTLVPATLGIMASIALLASWTFVNRTGGLAQSSEFLLLEFLTVFLTGFGTLVVAGMVVGLLPLRGRSRRGR